MGTNTRRNYRVALADALRGVTNLQTMMANYVNRGKAHAHGEQVTRAEFHEIFAHEAESIKSRLKFAMNAVAEQRWNEDESNSAPEGEE